MKILAIQFKYLGDLLIALPPLRVLQRETGAELHLAVAAEAAPLVEGLDWVRRVWALPRRRGKADADRWWPFVRALRRERFDRSVDLVGNDRGAFLSLFVGARQRLGLRAPLGFWGRRWCYTQTVEEPDPNRHETVRHFALLEAWGVPFSDEDARPARLPAPTPTLPPETVLCHLSTSQPKKEWPARHWAFLLDLLEMQGLAVALSSGPSAREQQLLADLRALRPRANYLPLAPDLRAFAATVAGARLLITGDTAPLHLAASLGVPTLALFGPTDPHRWAPLGPEHRWLRGSLCPCSGHLHACPRAEPCIAAILPETVADLAAHLLAADEH